MKFDYYNPPQSKREAMDRWPECSVFVKVCGGWAAFEYVADYEIWKSQI